MAFFFNGQRSSPVCPFYACKTGFVTHPTDISLILKILSKEDVLTREVPRGSRFADWYSNVWSHYKGLDHGNPSLPPIGNESEGIWSVSRQTLTLN